jgi:hypothetical protein
MSERLHDWDYLLASRERILEGKKKAQREVSLHEESIREITRLIAVKCLYDGHDWKQDCQTYGAGHYWSCKVCYSAAPGRHYDKPDKWFNIPRNKRKVVRGKQLRVRMYPNGEKWVIDG